MCHANVQQLLFRQFPKRQPASPFALPRPNRLDQSPDETTRNDSGLGIDHVAAIPKNALALVPIGVHCIYCLIVLIHLEHIVPINAKAPFI